jgi:hypothetical protein
MFKITLTILFIHNLLFYCVERLALIPFQKLCCCSDYQQNSQCFMDTEVAVLYS